MCIRHGAQAHSCGGDVEQHFRAGSLCGLCDMEVERGRIADDAQIDLVIAEVPLYASYAFIIRADLADDVVEHRGFIDGVFEQIAACVSHFLAAKTDPLDLDIAANTCIDSLYEIGTMHLGTMLAGTDKYPFFHFDP